MRAKQLIVVGHGAAGLAAALSAAEQARRQHLSADIVLLDKAGETEAGGNIRWSPSYMRTSGDWNGMHIEPVDPRTQSRYCVRLFSGG
jgi:succinate dehydrogenase/fumarate reductase flavoprotein subunit